METDSDSECNYFDNVGTPPFLSEQEHSNPDNDDYDENIQLAEAQKTLHEEHSLHQKRNADDLLDVNEMSEQTENNNNLLPDSSLPTNGTAFIFCFSAFLFLFHNNHITRIYF